jgi:uncharacterized caspase-like protein
MRRAFVCGSNGSAAIGQLKYARSNAAHVKAVLEDPSCGFDVVSPPAGATANELSALLERASAVCTEDDTFVFYFSGHGYYDNVDSQELYLCWDDADPQRLAFTTLPANTVMAALNRCKAGNRLLLLDCCRAAAAWKGQAVRLPTMLAKDDATMPSKSFLILAASDHIEQVPEFDDLEGTVFSTELCAALGKDRLEADRNRDGKISLSEIVDWLNASTQEHNARRPDPWTPYPLLYGGQRGEQIYLSDAAWPLSTLYTQRDVVERWLRWEAGQHQRLSYEQLNNRPDVVESPLSDLFSLSFHVGSPWHNSIATGLDAASSAAREIGERDQDALADRLRSVDCTRNYEDVRAQLRKVVEPAVSAVQRLIRRLARAAESGRRQRRSEEEQEKLNSAVQLRNALAELWREVISPQFGRCLLITGSLGAGRTHFVRTILNDDASDTSPDSLNDVSLILPLRPSQHFESVEATLRDAIREATGIGWQSLEEFDAFLRPAIAAGAPVPAKWQEQPRPIPLFVVIDDLGRWNSFHPTFLTSLTQFIAQHTKWHAVHWILTLGDGEYASVAAFAAFWKQYGLRRGGEWMSTSGATPTTERTEHSARSSSRGLLHVDGWIQLDEVNRQERLGVSIIRAELDGAGEAPLAFDAALAEVGEETSRLLSTPSLAWIALDQRDALALTHLVDLRFIALVQEYWNRCRAVLQQRLASSVAGDRLSLVDLDQAVELVARALLVASDPAPTLTQLLDSMTALAGYTSELRDRSKAEAAVRLLSESGLLRINIEQAPGQNLGTVQTIELPFEMFWEWQVARGWVRQHLGSGAGIDAVLSELSEQLARVKSPRLRHGIFTFFLLGLDGAARELPVAEGLIDGVWLMGLRSKEFFAATLMAAPKASQAPRDLLVKHVVQQPQVLGLDALLEDRYNLFAFMYFIAELAEGALDAPAGLEALQPHFGKIHAAGLSGYYLYLVRRIVSAIEDNAELKACMPAFSGCEVLGCPPEIADLTIEVLSSNASADVEEVGETVIEYLQAIADATRRNYTPQKGPWRRSYYREWVLAGFCRLLVSTKRLGAFDDLEEWDWYDARSLRIEHPVALEMEREANIALGHFYQRASSSDRRAFVQRVGFLAESKRPLDRNLAFHLIRHTVPTDGELGVVVDDVFHEILRRLFRDATLKWTVEKFHDVFRLNLPELRRQPRRRRPPR